MENYFAFYEIEPAFELDSTALKVNFYRLSRQYHPDVAARNGEAEEAEALRLSAINNTAYKTLLNPDLRLAHMLRLAGVLDGEEEKPALPLAFLMEMMDLNELLDDGNTEAAKQELETAFANLETEVQPAKTAYTAGVKSPEILKQLLDYYFRKKYLRRIEERVTL